MLSYLKNTLRKLCRESQYYLTLISLDLAIYKLNIVQAMYMI